MCSCCASLYAWFVTVSRRNCTALSGTGKTSPLQVLLLDEVTVDMDIVGRLDLLNFFKKECSERGATIVYATHIFDGLEKWATHLAHIANGELQKGRVPSLLNDRTEGTPVNANKYDISRYSKLHKALHNNMSLVSKILSA